MPFTYVKTFPRHIYQYQKDNDKPKDISEFNKTTDINSDSCIEFQPEALNYSSARDIQEIKNKITAENQEQPTAIHEQIQENIVSFKRLATSPEKTKGVINL